MESASLEKLYISLRRKHNDLRVVAGDGVDPSGFTLLAILRNEMYFLPDFLAHYRGLGVERFVFLNDRSDDGSYEYLLGQPDTVVVESDRTYGDIIDVPPSAPARFRNRRILFLWRALLHDLFAPGRWALQVDLDEFVHLPEGMTFPDLAARLDREGARAAWGVMLDVYPQDIAALRKQRESARLDMSAAWYFDGEEHLRITKTGKLRMVYPGARSRLYNAFGVDRLYAELGVKTSKIKQPLLRNIFGHSGLPKYNAVHKKVLLKWGENCYFSSSHDANLPAPSRYLLPIRHFRFCGSLYRKVETGLKENSYYRGSTDHRLLAELLRTMEARNGAFLYRKSRPFDTFATLAGTGNARVP